MGMDDLCAWKADAQKLIIALSAEKLSAYVTGLAQLWDNKELTAEERRKLPTMFRRELLVDRSNAEPERMAEQALARVFQNLQVIRSAERIVANTDVGQGDAA
jgi:hypothetical protein